MRRQGFTVWFMGLPSSGKSTFANMLLNCLRDLGYAVENPFVE